VPRPIVVAGKILIFYWKANRLAGVAKDGAGSYFRIPGDDDKKHSPP
jgi:hypothetical protein